MNVARICIFCATQVGTSFEQKFDQDELKFDPTSRPNVSPEDCGGFCGDLVSK